MKKTDVTSIDVKNVFLGMFVLTFCFFVGTLLYVVTYHFLGPGLCQPTITCDNPVRALGKVRLEQPVRCEFPIKNTGRCPLALHSIRPECGACLAVVSMPLEPIPSGESGIIRIEFQPARLGNIGKVTRRLAVLSNDPKQRVLMLVIHAQVVGV